MEFISNRTLRVILFTVHICNFCGVSPLVWNETIQRIEYTTSKIGSIHWHCIQAFYFLHQIFLTVRFTQSIMSKQHSFTFYMLQGSHFVFLFIMCGVLVSLTVNGKDWILFLNNAFRFYRQLQEEYGLDDAKKPKWQENCDFICTSLLLSFILFQPFVLSGLMLQMSHSELYVSSLLPRDPLTLILVSMPLNHILGLVTLIGLLPIFIFTIPFVYSSVALLDELRSNNGSSSLTKSELRNPATFLYTYRSLQILLIYFNLPTKYIFQIFLNNTVIIIAVLCLFVLIRFYSQLTIVSYLVFITGIYCAVTIILITYWKFGEINEHSVRVLRSWKMNQKYSNSNDRRLMIKYIHSVPALKVYIGTFGYYKKPNTIRTIGKLVYYTAKFLLMTKNFK